MMAASIQICKFLLCAALCYVIYSQGYSTAETRYELKLSQLEISTKQALENQTKLYNKSVRDWKDKLEAANATDDPTVVERIVERVRLKDCDTDVVPASRYRQLVDGYNSARVAYRECSYRYYGWLEANGVNYDK